MDTKSSASPFRHRDKSWQHTVGEKAGDVIQKHGFIKLQLSTGAVRINTPIQTGSDAQRNQCRTKNLTYLSFVTLNLQVEAVSALNVPQTPLSQSGNKANRMLRVANPKGQPRTFSLNHFGHAKDRNGMESTTKMAVPLVGTST